MDVYVCIVQDTNVVAAIEATVIAAADIVATAKHPLMTSISVS
jgi:hypothetical protein